MGKARILARRGSLSREAAALLSVAGEKEAEPFLGRLLRRDEAEAALRLMVFGPDIPGLVSLASVMRLQRGGDLTFHPSRLMDRRRQELLVERKRNGRAGEDWYRFIPDGVIAGLDRLETLPAKPGPGTDRRVFAGWLAKRLVSGDAGVYAAAARAKKMLSPEQFRAFSSLGWFPDFDPGAEIPASVLVSSARSGALRLLGKGQTPKKNAEVYEGPAGRLAFVPPEKRPAADKKRPQTG